MKWIHFFMFFYSNLSNWNCLNYQGKRFSNCQWIRLRIQCIYTIIRTHFRWKSYEIHCRTQLCLFKNVRSTWKWNEGKTRLIYPFNEEYVYSWTALRFIQCVAALRWSLKRALNVEMYLYLGWCLRCETRTKKRLRNYGDHIDSIDISRVNILRHTRPLMIGPLVDRASKKILRNILPDVPETRTSLKL